jgi:hypothetical protein
MRNFLLNVLAILMVLSFFTVSYGIVFVLRNHGINSCVDRGGTPVTRSWFSENPWDVSCVRLKR